MPDDVTVTDGDMVNVAFTPTNDSQKLGVGHAKGPDRSFEVMTGTSKGLAPGEYKISISLTPDVGKDKATKKMDEMGFFVQDFNMKCNRPASVLLFKVENDSGQSIKIDLQAGAISVSK